MPTQRKNDSEMFDPQKMQATVDRLRAEGRLPSLQRLDEVLREFRKEYQAKVRAARNRK
jgi:hypothetical protein